jgi:mRNA interferase RelE/StbE
MAYYEVVFRNSAARQLRNLEANVIRRVSRKIDELQINPFPQGFEQLKAYRDPPVYRIRIGAYRVLYTVDYSKKLITVAAIGHRREIYR